MTDRQTVRIKSLFPFLSSFLNSLSPSDYLDDVSDLLAVFGSDGGGDVEHPVHVSLVPHVTRKHVDLEGVRGIFDGHGRGHVHFNAVRLVLGHVELVLVMMTCASYEGGWTSRVMLEGGNEKDTGI